MCDFLIIIKYLSKSEFNEYNKNAIYNIILESFKPYHLSHKTLTKYVIEHVCICIRCDTFNVHETLEKLQRKKKRKKPLK